MLRPPETQQWEKEIMEYRRLFLQGGTYFFTVVTYQRRPIFATPQAIDLLRDGFRYTLNRLPFTVVASVILPDHMQFHLDDAA